MPSKPPPRTTTPTGHRSAHALPEPRFTPRSSLACQTEIVHPIDPTRVLFSDMTPEWSPGPVAEGQRRWAVVS